MKQYIIKIGNKTYYKYGGNTRDIQFASRFNENDLQIAKNVIDHYKYKNAKIVELTAN